MKLIVDHANIEVIKEMYSYFPIDGVTTNPSIISKEGRNPYEVLSEIRDFIGKDADLHVQVVSLKAEDMIEEAGVILDRLGSNTYITIPVTREGWKAMKELSSQGIKIPATAI